MFLYLFILNNQTVKNIKPYFQFASFALLVLLQISTRAQEIAGSVIEWDESMKMEMPIPGANVHIAGTDTATVSDVNGKFSFAIPAGQTIRLVTSFVGYANDTAIAKSPATIKIKLHKAVQLAEVNVTGKIESLGISKTSPFNTEKISEKEILKAACCNLSESFETNPTVNVAYTDAVTGAKEIQMLGLSGIYSQLLTENIPNMRGIAGVYGLTFIPGPWMESIQVTKGTGSVLNGYESTSGQLNVEFKKPQEKTTPRFYLNLFGEENSNVELNTFFKHVFDDKWSSILMLHGNYMNKDIDRNDDGFLDVPHNKQINVYNRWQYHSGKNIESQFGFKYLADVRHGGQQHSEPVDEVDYRKVYLADIRNNRFELFGKLGIVYPENPTRSIGNIISYQVHDLGSDIGLKHYDANQQSLYYQSIYQDIFGNTNHIYKTGISFQYDRLDEKYSMDSSITGPSQNLPSLKTRFVPGVFGEYTFSGGEKFKAVAGVREDYNSEYGWIFTPRLHLKYNFSELTLVRVSGGKSFREPYLIADNISVLPNSKILVFNESIKPEAAWNYGINFTKGFILNGNEGTFNVDFYRTDFINQLVVDRYSDSLSISFYNLEGKSFSNSFQVSLGYEVLHGLDVRLAYKMDDVKSTFNGNLERKPLIPKERVLWNMAFVTPNEHWKTDLTINWIGTQKLANTSVDPVYGKLPENSPDYLLLNFQVTKVFRKFEIYGGAENLLNYRQDHPIVAASEPFSTAFDASNIWGPVEGRRIYAGLRYAIK
jgi:outer membrane receptor for ferrienterochelin and colicins